MAGMIKKNASPVVVLTVLLALALAAVLVLMVRQGSELRKMRTDYESLLASTQTRPAPAGQPPAGSPGSAAVKPVETGQATGSEPAVEPAAKAPPRKRPPGFFGEMNATGLELAGTEVSPFAEGLRATMRFRPTQSESPGTVAMTIRLPRNSDSRILDLTPAGGGMKFSGVRVRVAEDGKFAIWHGTAENADTLEMELSVSGNAVAEVQGTAGIGPFELDIDEADAVVRPK